MVQAIEDGGNEKVLSIASLWEIAIKVNKGRLKLSRPLPAFLATELKGFEILPLSLQHVIAAGGLPKYHGDPFDRMLIAQAIVEQLSIVSGDVAFDAYGVIRIWA